MTRTERGMITLGVGICCVAQMLGITQVIEHGAWMLGAALVLTSALILTWIVFWLARKSRREEVARKAEMAAVLRQYGMEPEQAEAAAEKLALQRAPR